MAGVEADWSIAAAFVRFAFELNTNVALKGQLQTQPVEIDLPKMLAWSTQYRSELRQTEFQQELDALAKVDNQPLLRSLLGKMKDIFQ